MSGAGEPPSNAPDVATPRREPAPAAGDDESASDLRRRNETLQTLFAAAPVPLVLTGLDDAIVRYCNTRAAEMLDRPVGEIVGRRAPDFYVEPAARARFVAELQRTGRVESFAARLKTRTGAELWVLMSAHTLELEGDRVFMVGFTNITRQQEAQEELARLNASLSQALAVLEERDRRIREDLDEARAFQQRILPSLPASRELAFAAVYRPAEEVGGDIYDLCELGPGHFRIFLADATGHGVQAALRTMILKSEYDRLKDEVPGPAAALAELNRRIYAGYPGLELQCSATCFDVVTTADGGAEVAYATAAHPPLLLHGPGGGRQIYEPGPYLGVVEEIELRTVPLHLEAGGRLLAYTDGLVEQTGPDGRSLGVERLLAALADPAPLQTLVARVDAELRAAAGGHQDDDATLVAVECLARTRGPVDRAPARGE